MVSLARFAILGRLPTTVSFARLAVESYRLEIMLRKCIDVDDGEVK